MNALEKVNNELVLNKEWAENYRTYLIEKARWEIAEKELKNELLEAYKNGLKIGDNEFIKVVFKQAYQKESFDSKLFKEEQPELYNDYLKITDVAASISIQGKNM